MIRIAELNFKIKQEIKKIQIKMYLLDGIGYVLQDKLFPRWINPLWLFHRPID